MTSRTPSRTSEEALQGRRRTSLLGEFADDDRPRRHGLPQSAPVSATSDWLIFHSDQGSQYASHEFASLLRRDLVVQSMSRPGNCWDSAPMTECIYWENLRRATRRCLRSTVGSKTTTHHRGASLDRLRDTRGSEAQLTSSWVLVDAASTRLTIRRLLSNLFAG